VESHGASPLRTMDKFFRRRDAHSHGWIRGGVVYSGGSFWGFLGGALTECPSSDRSRRWSAAKATRERSCESNFWLQRVDMRGCVPVFVVALKFGLNTKPAPWDVYAGAWPSHTLFCFGLACVMIHDEVFWPFVRRNGVGTPCNCFLHGMVVINMLQIFIPPLPAVGCSPKAVRLHHHTSWSG
jgi:hypothetical protein